MAYRMNYIDLNPKMNYTRRIYLTSVFFLTFVLAVSVFYPEARKYIDYLVSRKGISAMGYAAESLVTRLKSGGSFREAWMCFYEEVAAFSGK